MIDLMIDLYAEEYMKAHPASSYRDACMAYAEERGYALPPPLIETEADREARLEREAIQNE